MLWLLINKERKKEYSLFLFFSLEHTVLLVSSVPVTLRILAETPDSYPVLAASQTVPMSHLQT